MTLKASHFSFKTMWWQPFVVPWKPRVLIHQFSHCRVWHRPTVLPQSNCVDFNTFPFGVVHESKRSITFNSQCSYSECPRQLRLKPKQPLFISMHPWLHVIYCRIHLHLPQRQLLWADSPAEFWFSGASKCWIHYFICTSEPVRI